MDRIAAELSDFRCSLLSAVDAEDIAKRKYRSFGINHAWMRHRSPH
jgi:hypothetical protein